MCLDQSTGASCEIGSQLLEFFKPAPSVRDAGCLVRAFEQLIVNEVNDPLT